jgi:hypothetical protein
MGRKITASGVNLSQGRYHGGYTVRCWTRYDEGPATEVDYLRLLFTEAVDVILAHLDHSRPGTVEGPGWAQPCLDGEDTSG